MYLHRRNGVYYFRRRIPKRLQNVLTPEERAEFHFSLQTSKRPEAVALRPGCIARTDEIQKAALTRITANSVHLSSREQAKKLRLKRLSFGKSFDQLTDNDLLRLHNAWFGPALVRAREEALDTHVHWGTEGRANSVEELGYEIHHLVQESDGPLAQTMVTRTLEDLLSKADCGLPPERQDNPRFRRFYNRVHQSMVHLRTAALKIVENGLEDFAPPPPVSGHETVFSQGEGKTLGHLIKLFRNDEKRKALRRATREEYEFIYRVLLEEFGEDRAVATISRDEVREIASLFKALPAHASQRFKGSTVRQMVEKSTELKLPAAHVKTFNKKAHQLSAIFHFAEREQIITSNPARNFGIPIKKVPGIGKSLPLEKLRIIFNGDRYRQFIDEQDARLTPGHPLKPCFFWVPLIALFSGMRSNEILQMEVRQSIFVQDEVATFRIIQTVKNEYSYRVVPIHSMLGKFGFFRYLENCRLRGTERLFPDAKLACDGKFSTWFQKPFSRYLKSLGIKESRKDCLHACRHNFIEGLRRADVPVDVRKALTGHSRVDSEEAMYGGEPLQRLSLYLEKLEYRDLDLSHLYVQ